MNWQEKYNDLKELHNEYVQQSLVVKETAEQRHMHMTSWVEHEKLKFVLFKAIVAKNHPGVLAESGREFIELFKQKEVPCPCSYCREHGKDYGEIHA